MRISVVVGLGVLLVATLGVTLSLRSQDARAGGNGSAAAAYDSAAVVCVVALAAAVVLGIYFTTDK